MTAIVPVFNGEHLVGDAIRSIRAQTRAVDELVVVDDGSHDKSADVAESLGARVIRLPKNQGPSAARNAALRAATGDVVAFLDADDEWLPGHLKQLIDALDTYPEATVASARTQLMGTPVYRRFAPKFGVPFDALPSLVRANFVPQSAVAARRSAILAAGGYDESLRFSEDYALWLTLARTHPFIAFADSTMIHRVHSGQSTWNKSSFLYASAWNLRLALLDDPILMQDAERFEAIKGAIRDSLNPEFVETWNARDVDAFRAVEAAAAKIPGARLLNTSWRTRRFVGWALWGALVTLKRRIVPRAAPP